MKEGLCRMVKYNVASIFNVIFLFQKVAIV